MYNGLHCCTPLRATAHRVAADATDNRALLSATMSASFVAESSAYQ